MAKKRTINEYSTDPAAQQMLILAEELWYRDGVHTCR